MRITKKGQITIPHKLREKLGFLPDTEVEIGEADGCIIVRLSADNNGQTSLPDAVGELVMNSPAKSAKLRSKTTAAEYVAKMDLPDELKTPMSDAGDRFQDKTFLPTMGDVRHFCEVYGITPPASGSRSSAIPRVFQFLSARRADEIESILNGGMFSGPARLGPIADAIREAGRNRARRTPLGNGDLSRENGGATSRPARLGPIADAIREAGKNRRLDSGVAAASPESRPADEDAQGPKEPTP